MFYLDVCKYIPALKFAQRRKLKYNWTLQFSTVLKHAFSPSSLIKSQRNAQYDVSMCSTINDLPSVTLPGYSWEDPARTTIPPQEIEGLKIGEQRGWRRRRIQGKLWFGR